MVGLDHGDVKMEQKSCAMPWDIHAIHCKVWVEVVQHNLIIIITFLSRKSTSFIMQLKNYVPLYVIFETFTSSLTMKCIWTKEEFACAVWGTVETERFMGNLLVFFTGYLNP